MAEAKQTNGKGWRKTDVLDERFVKYYELQGIITPENKSAFVEIINQPLPTSFRLTKNEFFEQTQQTLETLIEQIPQNLRPEKIAWYSTAYQINAKKTDIKKNPELKKIQEFMLKMNESGEVTRQEVVSMIPALLLDCQKGMAVLDVCAAPGSKTTQLIEMVGKEGCVAANDSDVVRSRLLVHQTKRLNAPQLLITNFRAQKLEYQSEQFDRLLCDVPCTGDGTLRKCIDAKIKFDIYDAYTIHREQIDIMKNVLHFLKVGGLFVYSTCSLNPIEDEAVVSEILRRYAGKVRLVDVANRIQGLRYSAGISEWKVVDRNYNEIHSFSQLSENKELSDRIPKTVFPPSQSEKEQFGLHKCMRILPFLQNTGGFFCALFEKTGAIEVIKKEGKEKWKKGGIQTEEQHSKKGNSWTRPKEMGVLQSITQQSQIVDFLRTFYNISSSFDFGQVYSVGNDLKSLYFVSQKAQEISQHSKLVCGGVQLFKCKKLEQLDTFRICSEGVSILSDFVDKERVIEISHQNFLELLTQEIPLEKFHREFRVKGCLIVLIGNGPFKNALFNCWVGKESLRLCVCYEQLLSFAMLFGISEQLVIK
ncbi:ribosomal RNA small subunit methyltransferase F, putative [Entamoeba invadens IP1]|uniref:Ribosomal RNA small subunit methyltransferase F, putative n=1 Tax=Entamoeba invadens IP1 TaxID=370355 RepID=A0A0A1TU12_ENTIV|nr:ribosomal RNA small subunit methyltransferase F, putative [Entamoeba invadens IP1]ELP83387.1 ribosomal RNA small subunit methyltransferase F, putative [Entamoeba invadens IP1]|eukprot:XP_004182733.1 ribosomal RNA small subunit methyltransferase F, putative [Entamoeba invadens IP1]